jgi:hypothetical protein
MSARPASIEPPPPPLEPPGGVVSSASVVTVKVSDTPPIASVAVLDVPKAAGDLSSTQMVWPLVIVPLLERNVPLQPTLYEPFSTDTGAAPVMPVMVTVFDTISVLRATPVRSAR